ncbi:MAG: putative integral rane transport protein [Acidimicrobiaceae bacterium]|jgi:multiple sugar transport system permease protein|nr:putative integral rane transport protein [Acidimicrobiaceae bacterium]
MTLIGRAERRLFGHLGISHHAVERRHGRRPSNVLTLIMLVMLVYFALPLFWLAVSSTKSVTQLFHSFGLWFSSGGFNLVSNVHEVFTYDGGVYVSWLGNTALYAVVSASGAALLAAAGGYGFAKFNFPGKSVLFAMVLGSIMVPFTALAVPTYLLLSKIGLVNTRWAIIIPSLLSPFGLYLMRVYAAGAVPDALIEAARLDGAGEFRIFRSIGFRLVAPGFVTVLLLSLVATWNNYFLPLIMLNNPRLFPVTVGLADWNSQATTGSGSQALYNIVITGSLLSIIPLIVAFLFLQRYWRNGLSLGSVTG